MCECLLQRDGRSEEDPLEFFPDEIESECEAEVDTCAVCGEEQ